MTPPNHEPHPAHASAKKLKSHLESIGLTATIEVKSRVIKVHVELDGTPMGAACIYPPKTVVKTHELKHPALPDVVSACAANRLDDARRILETKMIRRQELPEYAIYIASVNNHLDGIASYGAVVYKSGEYVESFNGMCNGAPNVGLAVAAATALEWCHANGVRSIVIHGNDQIMNWAMGAFKANAAGAQLWRRIFNECGMDVHWMQCTRESMGYGDARANADLTHPGPDDDTLWDYWRSRTS
jgi:hypothetical protein